MKRQIDLSENSENQFDKFLLHIYMIFLYTVYVIVHAVTTLPHTVWGNI